MCFNVLFISEILLGDDDHHFYQLKFPKPCPIPEMNLTIHP